MNKKFITLSTIVVAAGIAGWFLVHSMNAPGAQERKVLYWTDPMIPGDRSDHPGVSPMGMERIPVYDSTGIALSATTPEQSYYTCPMHPSVHQDAPGACPICGMTLVKKVVQTSSKEGLDITSSRVTVSSTRQILANVSTTRALKRSFTKIIHAAGTVNYAEPNMRHISARFPGRIEKLYVSFTGEHVRTGDPVLDLYSPEAISAEREYTLAAGAYRQAESDSESTSSDAKILLDQSKAKLLRWGFTEFQISELDTASKVPNTVTIYSPIDGTVIRKNVDVQSYVSAGDNLFDIADLSTVWLEANVYEMDIPFVTVGEPITASVDNAPGSVLSGKVAFISPTIDPSTRTIRVRATCSGTTGRLDVGMYADVSLNAEVPRSVVVPSSAVLSTGYRQIVWVKTGTDTFEGRLVTTGARSDEFTQIMSGIREGEEVVTSGGYLIDSESQLRTENEPPASSQQ